MPKAILEFNLPEDQEAHFNALFGADWKQIVSELEKWLRHEESKYENRNKLDITTIRSKLHDIISDSGLEL